MKSGKGYACLSDGESKLSLSGQVEKIISVRSPAPMNELKAMRNTGINIVGTSYLRSNMGGTDTSTEQA